MSLITLAFIAAWIWGYDHNIADARSPVTMVFIVLFAVRDIVVRSTR